MKYLLAFLSCFLCVLAVSADSKSIALDQSKSPIGLDDMFFSSRLNKVLVPAGRTGKLIMIDPGTQAIDSIEAFGKQASGGRGVGPTSVDEAASLLLVTDRTTHELNVVDPATKKIVQSAPLASGPDYVRFVKSTNEIWVTEPPDESIEIFSYPASGAKPVHTGQIAIENGPESLVIDNPRGLAYTNIDGGKTVVIELKTHKTLHEYENSCEDATGTLLSDSGQFLFVACREGKVVSMDPATGKIISSASSGEGIDIIAYNPKLKHIYAPGAQSATVAIIAVSDKGELSLVKTFPTVERAHCVVADNLGNFYVCDPVNAGLLMFKDE